MTFIRTFLLALFYFIFYYYYYTYLMSKLEMNDIKNISSPLDVSRGIHVVHNKTTGTIEGLPESWLKMINSQLR
jgi:hypothetical protein